MCLSEMELVFDRLSASGVSFGVGPSLSLPHTHGTEYVIQIQRTVFLGREYKVRWREAVAELELLCWGCVMLQPWQIQFVPGRAAQLAKRDWLFGCCCRNCLPLDPICSTCGEAFRVM